MINPKLVLSASSSNVVSKKYTGSDDQKWYFYRDDKDKTIIYNIGQGKYLYIEGESTGSNISLSDTQSDKNEIILDENLCGYCLMYSATHGNDDIIED